MNVMGHLPGLMEAEVARRLEHAPFVVREPLLRRLMATRFVWPLRRAR